MLRYTYTLSILKLSTFTRAAELGLYSHFSVSFRQSGSRYQPNKHI